MDHDRILTVALISHVYKGVGGGHRFVENARVLSAGRKAHSRPRERRPTERVDRQGDRSRVRGSLRRRRVARQRTVSRHMALFIFNH